MPATDLSFTSPASVRLLALGAQIRARRKALRVSATALAEAAGMSRVTVHRIEHGEPSVTMGAYLGVLAALGLPLLPETTAENLEDERVGWLPVRIRLADYPQLRQLAWQVQGIEELTPREALDIYKRNVRYLDATTLSARERQLIAALQKVFGETVGLPDGDV